MGFARAVRRGMRVGAVQGRTRVCGGKRPQPGRGERAHGGGVSAAGRRHRPVEFAGGERVDAIGGFASLADDVARSYEERVRFEGAESPPGEAAQLRHLT